MRGLLCLPRDNIFSDVYLKIIYFPVPGDTIVTNTQSLIFVSSIVSLQNKQLALSFLAISFII
jgi:hypothetical protein